LIVSGTHSTALLLGLTASHFARKSSVVGVSFSVEFVRAVLADEVVTLEWIVEAVRHPPKRGGHLVDLKGCLRNKSGEVCVSARGTVLVGRDTPSRK
jgi:acyl dehydratase